MISLDDILKVLDTWSKWKAMTGLPDRVAQLEARLKALENGHSTRSGPQPNDCPKCGGRMRVEEEKPHQHFAFAGVKVHDLKCDGCGNLVQRDYKPETGYR